MNHTAGLCGSYSTQLYTTLHSFTQRFVHVHTIICMHSHILRQQMGPTTFKDGLPSTAFSREIPRR